MKNGCGSWREALVEAALGDSVSGALADHVRTCESCARALERLRSRGTEIDRALPKLTEGLEPSPGFRTRVLASLEQRVRAKQERLRRQVWAAALVFAVFLGLVASWQVLNPNGGVSEPRRKPEISVAEWRSPTAFLLETPGRKWLREVPRLGESYSALLGKTRKKN